MNAPASPSRSLAVRCAIYTRKSTEEGLEQGFNSLDAQYEACAAYVASQRHEGWKLLPERFDDGGLSGGTMERPALQRLLAEVEAGRIGMIVVYKIDRLTRSLADFARLVEQLDRRGCSFVSVTQAFNTSTSMGRLTLNVLLSFAQFEREVTAERIRDKIAASKRKGLWMGGTLPLGYDPPKDPLKARVLEINPTEAETVRRLFALYLTAGTLGATRIAAAAQGLSPRKSDHATGAATLGVTIAPFSNGQLHYLLTNPVYRGMIRHKTLIHPGQHEAIIDESLWSAVQTKLQETAARKRQRAVAPIGTIDADSPSIAPQNSVEPSAPLMAKLYDETGDRLTPSHTNRHNRRFRYYISRRLITEGADPTGWRLPAPHLEAVVLEALRGYLRTRARQHDLLLRPEANTAGVLAEGLNRLSGEAAAQDLWPLISEVHITAGSMIIHFSREALAQSLSLHPDALNPDVMRVQQAFQRRRRGAETRLVTGTVAPQPDPVLQQNLARAHRWANRLRKGESLSQIARAENCSDSLIRSRVALAFLAPDLQRAILDGTAPSHLTTNLIVRMTLPHDWQEQAKALGL